jgi:hypothetical protein
MRLPSGANTALTTRRRGPEDAEQLAALGRLVVGRKGKEPRFELDGEEAAAFLRAADADHRTDQERQAARTPTGFTFPIRRSPRVFITCRSGGKILKPTNSSCSARSSRSCSAGTRPRRRSCSPPCEADARLRYRIVQVDVNVLPREVGYAAIGRSQRTVRSAPLTKFRSPRFH